MSFDTKFHIDCTNIDFNYRSYCDLVVDTPPDEMVNGFSVTFLSSGSSIEVNNAAICNKFRTETGGYTTPCARPYWVADGVQYSNDHRVLTASNSIPGGRIRFATSTITVPRTADGESGAFEIRVSYSTETYGHIITNLSASYNIVNTRKVVEEENNTTPEPVNPSQESHANNNQNNTPAPSSTSNQSEIPQTSKQTSANEYGNSMNNVDAEDNNSSNSISTEHSGEEELYSTTYVSSSIDNDDSDSNSFVPYLIAFAEAAILVAVILIIIRFAVFKKTKNNKRRTKRRKK